MKFFISLFVLLFCLPAFAREVVVTGRADIQNENMAKARKDAIDDALYQASLQAGVRVSSTQILQNFTLAKDQVKMKTGAKVNLKEVVSEERWKDEVSVTLIADVTAENQCSDNDVVPYRKTLVVAGFELLDARQGSLGRLGNIEQKLPEVLALALNNRGHLRALSASGFHMARGGADAPAFFDNKNLDDVLPGHALGSQFVLSGVVRNLSMINPDADKERFFDEALDSFGWSREKPLRQFVLDVFIHDAFSGALMFQQAYAAQGNWSLDEDLAIGFASPQFWKQDYGRQVKHVLQQVVHDVDNTLACQPFMGKVASTHGKQLRINAGTASGLRPGDDLNLYRTRSLYDANQKIGIDLQPTQVKAKIIRVLPTFALAELSQTAMVLGIQQDDVLVAE